MDGGTDGRTDGQTERPLAIARSIVRRMLTMQLPSSVLASTPLKGTKDTFVESASVRVFVL